MASSISGAATLVVQLLSTLPASEQAALLEACSLAHQDGRCIEASEAREEDTLRASVDFSSEVRVTLEITDTAPGRSFYASRELFFEASDDREERARAIGLALGVIATTLIPSPPAVKEPPPAEEEGETAPEQRPEPKTEQREPTKEVEAPHEPGRFGVSLSGGASVLPRWGASAPTGALALLGYPHPQVGGVLRAQLASFPPGSRDISMTQVGVTFGPSVRTATAPFFASAALTGGVQSTEARLNLASATVQKGSHLSPLAHVEVAFGRALVPGVSLTLTPAFDFLFSDAEITVDGETVGRTGTTHASVLLGVLLMPSPSK